MLFRIPPTIEEILVDCSIQDNKLKYSNRLLPKREKKDYSPFSEEENKSESNDLQSRPNFFDKRAQNIYNDDILENKRLALLSSLSMNSNVERTLIFCNTIASCRNVENVLFRADRNERVRRVSVTILHA